MELEDTNPWPRRIILVGAGFFIIASIAWLSNADNINQVFDPRESATQQTNGDGIHNIVLDEGCWTITSIGQTENLNVSVFEIEGSSLGEEITESCRSDFEPQSIDDTEFTIVKKVKIAQLANVSIDVSCDTPCDGLVLYFNSDAQFYEDLIQPSFIFMISFCCLGIIMMPLGGVLMLMNRAKQQPVNLIQPQDDMVHDPSTMNTTDELYKLIRQTVEEAESKEKQNIPPPFAGQGQTDASNTMVKPITSEQGSFTQEKTSENSLKPPDDAWKKWDGG